MSKLPPITPSRPYLYLPDGWDTGWKAAKSSVASAPATVMVLGDSIGFGQQADDPMTHGYSALLRSYLVGLYGEYATCWASTFNATTSGLTSASGFLWAATSGTAPAIQGGFGFGNTLDAGDATTVFTFTTPAACTSLDILSHNHINAATFQYAIDGGGAVTITNNGSDAITRTPVASLANTTHTVAFKNASTAAGMAIPGVTTYSGAAGGIGFCNMSQPGAQTVNVLKAAVLGNIQGKTPGGAATGNGFPAAPNLIILALGVNDLQSANLGPTGCMDLLKQAIYAARRGNAACSVILLINYGPDPTYSDCVGWGNGEMWYLWCQMHHALARQLRCAVVDVNAKWGSTGLAQGFATASGNAHPSTAGHADIAALLEGIA